MEMALGAKDRQPLERCSRCKRVAPAEVCGFSTAREGPYSALRASDLSGWVVSSQAYGKPTVYLCPTCKPRKKK